MAVRRGRVGGRDGGGRVGGGIRDVLLRVEVPVFDSSPISPNNTGTLLLYTRGHVGGRAGGGVGGGGGDGGDTCGGVGVLLRVEVYQCGCTSAGGSVTVRVEVYLWVVVCQSTTTSTATTTSGSTYCTEYVL